MSKYIFVPDSSFGKDHLYVYLAGSCSVTIIHSYFFLRSKALLTWIQDLMTTFFIYNTQKILKKSHILKKSFHHAQVSFIYLCKYLYSCYHLSSCFSTI